MLSLHVILQKLFFNYWSIFLRLVFTISFYPCLGILIGGTLLNIHNGSIFAFQLTLYFLWLTIIAPLWFMGQYWTALLYLPNSAVEISKLNELLGYHIILLAFLVLIIFLIYHVPRVIFSFYFLVTGSQKPVEESIKLTQKRYWQMILHLALVSSIAFVIVQGVNLLVSPIPGLLFQLYTPEYIFWANITRNVSAVLGNGLATVFSMSYFYRLWLKMKTIN